jgi:alpha-L-fucosidase
MQDSSHPWEESRGMGFSYGFNRAETLTDYHTERQLVLMLIDIVSRGGNLLLDIGPRADGEIPVVMEERLIQIGSWLQPNGEAIYGTRPWKRAAQWSAGAKPHLEQSEFMSEYDISKLVDEPPPGTSRVEAFFTSKNDTVYVIVPRWPGPEFVIHDATAASGAKCSFLETGHELPLKTEGNNVTVNIAGELRWQLPHREAYVIAIQGLQSA